MDYLAILSSHLDFISRFYDATASPLETKKGLIERGESPFDPKEAPEDFDGFEYQDEWDDADNFLRVLGESTLTLLTKSLQDYLRALFKNEGKQVSDGGDWFQKYSRLLEELPRFAWSASPVTYAQLEQINLARNNFMHGQMIGNLRPQQDRKHFRKYPASAFAEPWEVDYWKGSARENDEPWGLNVTRASLQEHIELARLFCTYVEEHRTVF